VLHRNVSFRSCEISTLVTPVGRLHVKVAGA
jgi:hypothetical protein